MTKIAMSDYKNDFLGGQNHIKYLIDLPQHIDKSNVTAYDGVIMDILQASMVGYIEGTIKEDKAWADFKAKVLELYPDMTFDF